MAGRGRPPKKDKSEDKSTLAKQRVEELLKDIPLPKKDKDKLASKLDSTNNNLIEAEKEIDAAWKICFPYMLKDLETALEKSWCRETCYPKTADLWTPENISLGQCAITSLIVQDNFGGDIYYCKHNFLFYHF